MRTETKLMLKAADVAIERERLAISEALEELREKARTAPLEGIFDGPMREAYLRCCSDLADWLRKRGQR